LHEFYPLFYYNGLILQKKCLQVLFNDKLVKNMTAEFTSLQRSKFEVQLKDQLSYTVNFNRLNKVCTFLQGGATGRYPAKA
jgi:hypothetical protein